jgi:hypothetical protein
MVIMSKWFERKFNFDFPVTIFPSILERLRGTPARLEETISSLSPSILTTQVDNGWSIQENVGHLLDLEPLHESRIDDFLSHAKVLRAADLQNRKTKEASHNTQQIKTLLSSFRSARLNFVKRLEELDENTISRTAIHPRLNKPMRMIDMAFFTAEHDDHHLATITGLAKRLQGKKIDFERA